MTTTAEEALEQLSRMNSVLSAIVQAKTKLPPSCSQADIDAQRTLVRRLIHEQDYASGPDYWQAKRDLEAAEAKLRHMEGR